MSFTDLGLAEGIVRAVTENGYTNPTPIQAQAVSYTHLTLPTTPYV